MIHYATKDMERCYWNSRNIDFVNINGNISNPTENERTIKVQKKNFLDKLQDLRRLTVQTDVNDAILSNEWDLYGGISFPRKFRIKNNQKHILMVLEEQHEIQTLFSLSVFYDGIELSSDKFDLLEQILIGNSPASLKSI